LAVSLQVTRVARVTPGLAESTAGFVTHVTWKLTAKNRDQLRNPTLGNRRVWATFTFVFNPNWGGQISASFLLTFRRRLKTFLFQASFADIIIIIIIYCYTTRVAHDTYMYIHKKYS